MVKNIFQKLYYRDLRRVYKRFGGIILDNVVQNEPDLQIYFEKVRSEIKHNERVLISYHNHFWEPILNLTSILGLRKKVGRQNWLDKHDIENLLSLAGFEVISTQKRFFGLTMITIARIKQDGKNRQQAYSVSIVVPARNEEGNIEKIIPSIPKFGKWQEIIFVEGHSNDNTWGEINKQINKYANKQIKVLAFRQTGKGKADAVWIGFEKAKGDILMIYDADRTVDAEDLPKFYNALSTGIGEFANGSRMIYPMENQAMQTLNKVGNKIFSILFTWILGQRFKDTLCGTKVLFKIDYLFMKKFNKNFFRMDPFGDFALIFGAVKNNLKVVEIPIRYKDRLYGKTNISRFTHGLILLKMTLRALIEFKFW